MLINTYKLNDKNKIKNQDIIYNKYLIHIFFNDYFIKLLQLKIKYIDKTKY